jgi:superoxide reductase
MTERDQVYKCERCGNIVEVVHASGGVLVCCGQPMALQAENTVDAAIEKHLPVLTAVDGGFHVVVGSVAHPMADAHLIEWIELIAGDTVLRRHLSPGDAPEATFRIDAGEATARAYCNLHGHWQG